MFKISIIIPAYNVGNYLENCLESIIKQTLSEIEILCIDDGSVDNTPEIIESYVSRFKNFKAIQQENRGAGIARNLGILMASGEYIAFMDGDDFYPENDILETLYKNAVQSKAELCGGSFSTYSDGAISYTGFREGYVVKKEGLIKKEEYEAFGGYTRFIYSRKFLLENAIYFPDYRRFQDPPFFLNALSKAEKVYVLRKVSYCYRKNHKQVEFDFLKSLHLMKGMRDVLKVSVNCNMKKMFTLLVEELNNSFACLAYRYIAENSQEMISVWREIREIISSGIEKFNIVESYDLLGIEEAAEFVKSIPNRKALFLKEIRSSKHRFIYGAGVVGRKVEAFLKKNGIPIDAFVVTNKKENVKSVDEIRVEAIDDILEYRDTALIIVATFEYLHNEIGETLKEKRFKNVIFVKMNELYLYEDKIMH